MIKVLIVEDEAGIRQSISGAFPWLEMGCELIGATDSGLNAIEICLKTPPDIVISDIVMPGIDGLSFMRFIRERSTTTQFIILTGHRNFDFAKDALNLGAAFFLTKPIVYTELHNAVQKLIDKINDEQESKKIINQQEQILRNLLSGRIYNLGALVPQVKAQLENLINYQVVVVRFDHDPEDILRMQKLLTFCENQISGQGVLMVKADNQNLVLIINMESSESNPRSNFQYLTQIQQRINEYFHNTVSIGISPLHNGFEQLRDAYVEALRALERKFFSGNSSINFFLSDEILSNGNLSNDYQLITTACEEIVGLVDRPESENFNQTAREFFYDHVKPLGNQIDLIKSAFISIATLTTKKILKDDSRQLSLLFDKYASFRKVISCESLDELSDLFVNLLMDLADYRSIKSCNRKTLFTKIFTYIEEHYQQSITLNDIAKTVYLSPNYLSSIITNETGKGFPDILNEVRIKKAAELLKDPKLKIADIAYAVGYNEPQYFTMTFKKYMEITPRDYRESQQK